MKKKEFETENEKLKQRIKELEDGIKSITQEKQLLQEDLPPPPQPPPELAAKTVQITPKKELDVDEVIYQTDEFNVVAHKPTSPRHNVIRQGTEIRCSVKECELNYDIR